MESSAPVRTETVRIQNKDLTVNVMLDMKAAKIWTVEDFITDEECKILQAHGKPRLARATVAGEDGLGTVSQSRKAQQASYNPSGQSDPLWKLYERVFEFTKKKANYNLDYPGQEGFTIIQYNVDDQYTPHCDGACDGSKHLPKGRVATAVMYCQLPEEGGGTSFTKADVFVQPKRGMATVFAYRDNDGYMDHGFTEHSGCPVLKGEKWITTLWMRDGVDAKHTWAMYDPSGEPDPADRKKKVKPVEQEVSAT
ncbi:P4ha1 [Symbiodinium microadriaticum]|nr:P4ha1 [Symbiodinium microadriaticum]